MIDAINNYRVDHVRNKSFICMHVFLTNYSFGATMSRQPSSLQLPRGQPLQPRGVVYQRCPVHDTVVHTVDNIVDSNFSSLGGDISQRQPISSLTQPISLTPQQRFELMFMGPCVSQATPFSHYYIIAPQTDRPVLQPHSHLEFYHSSGTSHRNPILDCSIQYTHLSTPPPISPRPLPSLISSANLGATANIPVIKNIETKPHEELVISIADISSTEPPDSSTLLSDQPYVPPSVQIFNPPCSQRIAPYFIPHYQIRNQFRPLFPQCYSSHRDFPSPPLSQILQGCKHPPPQCWYEQSTNTDIPTDPQTSISMPIPIFPEPSVKETEDIELTDDPYSSPSVFQNLNLLLPKSYAKPPYSFSALIAMAISSSPRRMSTTSDIYNYISTTFPFYDRSKRAWKNAVRNCLNTNECFRKAPFAPKEEKSAQCNYWIIDPLSRKTFMKGSFQTPKTSRVKRPKRHETKLKSSTVGVSLDSILLTYAAEFSIRTIPNSSTNIKELVPSVNKETSVICLMQRPPSPT